MYFTYPTNFLTKRLTFYVAREVRCLRPEVARTFWSHLVTIRHPGTKDSKADPVALGVCRPASHIWCIWHPGGLTIFFENFLELNDCMVGLKTCAISLHVHWICNRKKKRSYSWLYLMIIMDKFGHPKMFQGGWICLDSLMTWSTGC